MVYVKGFTELCKINIIFRKKIYSTLEELQLDIGCILTIELDLIQVNIATAMQTFFDNMHIAYQKNIDNIKIDSDIGFDFVDSSVR